MMSRGDAKYTPPDLPGLVFYTNDSTSLSDEELALVLGATIDVPACDVHVYHQLDEGKSRNNVYVDEKHRLKVLVFLHEIEELSRTVTLLLGMRKPPFPFPPL